MQTNTHRQTTKKFIKIIPTLEFHGHTGKPQNARLQREVRMSVKEIWDVEPDALLPPLAEPRDRQGHVSRVALYISIYAPALPTLL